MVNQMTPKLILRKVMTLDLSQSIYPKEKVDSTRKFKGNIKGLNQK